VGNSKPVQRRIGLAYFLIAFSACNFVFTVFLVNWQVADGKYPSALAGVCVNAAMVFGLSSSFLESRPVRLVLYVTFFALILFSLYFSSESIRRSKTSADSPISASPFPPSDRFPS
jgi:hypothetical protein